MLSLFSSPSSLSPLISTLAVSKRIYTLTTMSISLHTHAFASNPIRSKTPKPTDPFSPTSALEILKTRLLDTNHRQPISPPDFKVLPFRKGRPLASSSGDTSPNWHLGWISLADCKGFLAECRVQWIVDSLVYLGSRSEEDEVFWAIDVSEESALVSHLGSRKLCFVELRTLMVATDWADERAMGELAIAGHARALLEWHTISRFCGYCGEKTVPMEAGRWKQCSSELCKKSIYPRVDPVTGLSFENNHFAKQGKTTCIEFSLLPSQSARASRTEVVIMLVIDTENDRALLSRRSRFVPRMWSCLAGFIEPGESLEEAVRRETWEETGIEVGEVIYHSSQPWPVGPSSMPSQLMVGFFAYAKSLDINVDKEELEDARWHNREDVKKALTYAEYRKAQQTAAVKVDQMCKGVEKGQNLAGDFNVESGELAPMFVPGPFAIAHRLISYWVDRGSTIGDQVQLEQPSNSLSNL